MQFACLPPPLTAWLQLRECFVIEFDQDAYLAAAAGRAAVEDFFYSRMVLSEGSRVRCRDPDNGNIEVGGTEHGEECICRKRVMGQLGSC